MTWIAAAMASAAATTAVIQYVNSEQQAKKEGSKQDKLNANMSRIEAARQKIPYIGRHYKDLSNTMSNKMANLGVATGAAEMQAEEADIALANMADVMQATGQDAGGATALAQMALKSKQGISANIQQQEAANQKARAQGEANLQAARMSEKARIQGAKAQSEQWRFGQQESREVAQLNRQQSLIDQSRAQEMALKQQQQQAVSDMSQAGMQMGMAMGTADWGGTGDPKSGTMGGDINFGTQDPADKLSSGIDKDNPIWDDYEEQYY